MEIKPELLIILRPGGDCYVSTRFGTPNSLYYSRPTLVVTPFGI